MTTYKELVNIVLDELKLISDDSVFQPEHVLFLLDKYRGFILKQRYSDIKKEIPESNFQTICVDLEQVPAYQNDTCGGNGYLKSTKKIPEMMTIGGQKISTSDYFQGNLTYVNKERFKYVGENKYLKNTIYGTIGPDSYLYMKSSNPQAYHLCKVRLTGIFEDSGKASELSCEGDENPCDVMDRTFPLEEALIPVVTDLIVKELGGQRYQPEDKQNNASDDLSDLATYMRNQLALGRRSDLYKGY
jgi:hypothetical protein